jgi:hypothetical protein
MITEIVEQGERHLAIPIGAVGRGSSHARILALKRSPGWLAREGRLTQWRFQGVAPQAGELLLYGPLEPGRLLVSVLARPLVEALPYLERLVDALLLLQAEGADGFPLQTDAILFPDQGGVLFLPPEIMREIRGLRPFEKNREVFEAVNHPDLTDEAASCFSVSTLLYRVITGRYPFTGQTAEEIHEQARSLQVPSPGLEVPEISPEVSSLVMAGLGRLKGASPSLRGWRDALSAWQGRDQYRQLPADEKARRVRESSAVREGSERRFRQRVFWRRHWKLIAVVTAAVIIVGAGLGSVLSNVFAPRPTRGFDPRKVVESFYLGMNSLDHATMEACVVNGAGRQEITEATNLYVITRVTAAYEGKPNIVPADGWDRDGRPPLDPLVAVYGVTGLLLTQEQGEPQPVFKVDYEKWAPLSSSDEDSGLTQIPKGPRFAGTRTTDRVFLRLDKGDWVIYRMDRLSASAMDSPK